jgi:cysteine-rich repeat protein
MSYRHLALVCLVFSAACSTPKIPPAASRSTLLDMHENCSGAATLFEAGGDDDGDGVLSDAEVDTSILSCRNASEECTVTTEATQIRVACTGKATQVIAIEAEKLVVAKESAPDSRCLNGGFSLSVGLDDGQGAGEPGDGILHPDEVDASTTVCSAFCGDGTTDALEQCDDGNRDSGDGCDALCGAEPSCMPPMPDPSCPVVTYFVDSVSLPAQRSLAAFDVTLRGVFPAGAATAARVSDSAPLTIASATTGEVQVSVPSGTGSDALTLTISGSEIAFLQKTIGSDGAYTIAPAPIAYSYGAPLLSSVEGCAVQASPLDVRACSASDTITIRGENFSATATDFSVSVGGAACTAVTLIADGVTCQLPAGQGVTTLALTVDGLPSNAAKLAYVMPEIANVTFDPSPTPTSSVKTLTITGAGFSSSAVAKYGRDGVYFPCATTSATNNLILCTLTPGSVGADLHVIVRNGPADDAATSLPSAFTFSYLPPSIVDGSLRSPGGPSGSTANVSSIGGETIVFDVENLGTTSSQVAVSVGGKPCLSPLITGSATDAFGTVECVVPPGQGSQTFSVSVFGQSDTSQDEVVYSAVPTVTSINGECGGQTPCSREGGARITISGTNFVPTNTSVFVDDAQCPIVFVSAPSAILCEVPPGKGNATVRVFSDGVPSSPGALQYALPHIETITGCQDQGVSTTQCPSVASGVKLTINGTNFGANEALVFVGPNECTGVEHDVQRPNRRLTCTLPPGAGTNQSVRVVNDGASPPFYISYQE